MYNRIKTFYNQLMNPYDERFFCVRNGHMFVEKEKLETKQCVACFALEDDEPRIPTFD